jgi:predicted dehydrogenase
MSVYRVGIVGLSDVAIAPADPMPTVLGGEQPHSHAASYAAVPETAVVAVCDLDRTRFGAFDEQWGHRWPGVSRYTSYREMLERERLDLLSVVTSDDRHADVVVAAAAATVRGIFCEKPISTTLADADRMIAAVEESGTAMVVNHSRRWWPQYLRAREVVRRGKLGAVTRINAVLGGPRAMLFRNGTHLIDMITYFAASEPVWVVGHLDPGHEQYGPRYAGRGGREAAYDPGATALIQFANGVFASYHGTKTVTPGYGSWELTVYGERGTLRLREPGGGELSEPVPDPLGTSRLGLATQTLTVPQYRNADGPAAIRELIDLIERPGDGTRTGQCSTRDARRVLGVLLAILQSQHQGNRPVTAPFVDAE